LALGSWLLASDFRLSAMAGLFFHESRVPNVRAIYIFVMVKLPDPVQPLLPVRVQVPVMVLPLTGCAITCTRYRSQRLECVR